MALTALSRSLVGVPCLVTGAASGMGRATAMVLAEEGAKVAVTDLGADRVAAVVDEINAAGKHAIGFELDVSDPDAISRVVDEAAAQLGGLQVLVNNAGVSLGSALDGPDFETVWAKTFAVNLDAHHRTIRAALPYLEASPHPRVVNIASTEGWGATAYISAYTASKHAVIGLTKSLAVELGPKGITVNCICPGPIRTGMTQAIPDESKVIYAKRRTALKRYGDPEEVAHMTVSMCLPAASFCTGGVLLVDGGMFIRN